MSKIVPRKLDDLQSWKIFPGKIAIEEAINTDRWNGSNTLPPTSQIPPGTALPFAPEIAADIEQRLTDIPKRIENMEACGIRYQILSLTSPGIEGIFDTATAIDYAKYTNDFIYEKYVKAYPTKFGFFACVPTQDPAAAAKELERAVKQLGAKGALINGYCQIGSEENVQYLDSEKLDVFWAKVEELRVPIYIHPRCPAPSQQLAYKDYPLMAQAAYGFSSETAAHALRLMLSGLFDRRPSIQIVLGHAGEALPFIIDRVDQRLLISAKNANGPYQQNLHHYLENNFIITMAGVRRDSTLQDALAEIGEDRVLFSVDYPYESNEVAVAWFDSLAINGNTKRKLASTNAERIFGIPL